MLIKKLNWTSFLYFLLIVHVLLLLINFNLIFLILDRIWNCLLFLIFWDVEILKTQSLIFGVNYENLDLNVLLQIEGVWWVLIIIINFFLILIILNNTFSIKIFLEKLSLKKEKKKLIFLFFFSFYYLLHLLSICFCEQHQHVLRDLLPLFGQ